METASITASSARPPLEILQAVFGHREFRGEQAAITAHVIAGGDAIVLMPTGGGKSVCYQIPALCRPGVAVVVSPLIALMADQVASLRQAGVKAAALNSGLTDEERWSVWRDLKAGRLDLLYVAPERLLMPAFLELLDGLKIALFAIDEAHCVSQWGHDFRPEYMKLDLLPARYPDVPRLALTATADPQTREDIRRRLKLEEARLFLASFDRPNIRYAIALKKDPRRQLLSFIRDGHQGESGIVYCLSRAKTEETAAWLNSQKVEALPYHAGLDAGLRRRNQTAFLNQEGLVLVATIAFGMGIDKPDVRFVAHLDLPGSLEAYYQETGRAGRDGLPAETLMLYGMQDVVLRRNFIEEGEAPPEVKRVERAKLEALLGLCESVGCRRQALLAYFGERLAEPCGNCDGCLSPAESWDGTVAAQKALSAAFRTGQRFGVAHLIDLLRGIDSEKIMRHGHDNLPTFGVGKDLDAKAWSSVFRQLVALGALEVAHDSYGALRLTEAARPILRGERSLDFRHDQPAAGRRRRERGTQVTREALDGDEMASGLFQALRAARSRLARAQGVPPYVIFHDSTLIALASRRPQSLEALAEIPGMGERKIERYGAAVLAILRGEERPQEEG
ncbi:MAG TPA: DNA helicase RecQ [Dongiaceae bacterium]|nr:DNA helicase RecQ [Dongiaceae bacterium]